MNAPDLSISRALELHQQGSFAQAAAIYQALLQADPQHFDSLHLLGVLACQLQQYDHAAVLIGEALALRPDVATAHNHLGNALKGLGRREQALHAYQTALTHDPYLVDAHYNLGTCLQEQGQLKEAIASYRMALGIKEDHILALMNLGTALGAMGKPEEALGCLDRVLNINPLQTQALSNRGNVLKSMGRVDDAIRDYRQAVHIDPSFGDGYFNLGVALQSNGQFLEALDAYAQAEQQQPDNAEIQVNMGVAYRALQQTEKALYCYDRAIELSQSNPGQSADAWCNRGSALKDLQRLEEALSSYERALIERPRDAGILNNRGNVLRELHRHADSLSSYEQALVINPDYAEAWANKGAVLREMGRFNEALICQERALRLNPGLAQAHGNRGVVLESLNRPCEALQAYERALELQPDYAEALSNRGNLLRDMGLMEEAMASHEKATNLKPQMAAGQWNKALALLTMGRFSEGWPLYEWGWETRERGIRREFGYPLWLGETSLSGKTILLHSEQGLGDTFQFCRFVPEVAALGARVILEVPNVLHGVLQGLAGVSQWVIRGEALPEADFHCPLMSLPLALGTQLHSIPYPHGYLSAEATRMTKWGSMLESGYYHIGVCWQGSQRGQKVGNAFPLSCLEDLSQLPRVKLYSLQRGSGTEQLATLPPGMQVVEMGEDFDNQTPFADTAALMKRLDLVITTDTSVAHLAGALGVRTWVALRFVPDWRWLLDRQDCPWYDRMRLFRQAKPGDWSDVFEAMKEELRVELHQTSRSETINVPHVPVSWGEVIDKITILEIKQNKITDAKALAHVNAEHGQLWNIALNQLSDNSVNSLFENLKAINEALWVVEDRLRELESSQSFGDEFIQQARSVYRLNDERARLKRCINDLTGSALREEKSYWQQAA